MKPCEACGAEVTAKRKDARFCSESCAKRTPCKRCGSKAVKSGKGARFCPPCEEVARSADYRREVDNARNRRRREEAIASGTFAHRRKAHVDGEKWCARCQRFLPVKSFAVNKDKPAAYCIPCQREYNHARTLDRQYGITSEQYDDLLQLQEGRCAICLTRPRKRRLAVDHDHGTGEIRGLLCTRCNHGLLGKAHDSAAMLRRAVTYLTRPPAQVGVMTTEDADTVADLEFIEEQCAFLADGDVARHATRDLIAVTPATFLALAQAAGFALVVEGERRHTPPVDLAIDDLLLLRKLHETAMQREAS